MEHSETPAVEAEALPPEQNQREVPADFIPKEHIFNTRSRMSNDEISELSFHLQKHHAIFHRFFNVGTPIFDTSLPTAAVYAERGTGKFLYLKINPIFWRGLSLNQKLFIIAHECLHLILNHLTRLSADHGADQTIANYAADLVVNHACVDRFNFKRSEIDPENKYCWIDSFFKPEDDISSGETMEYYYDQLIQKAEKNELNTKPQLVDGHEQLSPEEIDEILKQWGDTLTSEELQSLRGWLEGQGVDGLWNHYKANPVKKKKWETIIKKWAFKTMGKKEKMHDQWARMARRFAFLKYNDMFLPSEMEVDEVHREKHKIDVFFWLDTSGSCHHLAERFFTAAKTLPEERFNIRLFCFHDYVVEVKITDDKVHMGGGTRFDIIEARIQQHVKEGGKYPTSFVITDGYASPFECEKPEMWHWFLSEDYKTAIPDGSKIYMLEDFE